MKLPDSSILTNIHFPGIARPGNLLFEKKYISIRCIENRLYTDEEVERLPEIAPGHPHAAEWQLRKRSARRLKKYIAAKNKRLSILEIGCGNGWLAHNLATIPGSEVTGIDINFTELQQAARVFNVDPHLKFIYGDIAYGALNKLKFDVIVFSASVQYFRSLRKTLTTCLNHINPNGEIHILDTHLYKTVDILPAKKRTTAYYTALGYPEMADYYFHHDVQELQAFRHTILYNPFSLMNRFAKEASPFHWVCIRNN